ncbi:glycosyltransferase [Candidatus Woesearchaeota archaeon]|nr:glycosyltransferase [Candidatus Woesearchaeota archaeon]
MKPFVSIITPVKDELGFVQECIHSVQQLSYPKQRYEHIIIVDAASAVKDSIIELKHFFSRQTNGRINLQIIPGGIGSAANRNIGVEHASPKAAYLAFTDADCAVANTWLSVLVGKLESTPGLGVVGGLNITPASDSRLAHLLGALESTLLGGGNSAQATIWKHEKEVVSIPNCNAVYRKELWQQERQDETLLVGQDGEFNYRLKQHGVRFLITPKTFVYHHRQSSFFSYLRRMYKYGQATRRTFRKHHGILQTRWYALGPVLLLLGSLILLLMGVVWPFAITILQSALLLYISLLLLTMIIEVIPKVGIIGALTPFVLLSQHVLYGIGFLRG